MTSKLVLFTLPLLLTLCYQSRADLEIVTVEGSPSVKPVLSRSVANVTTGPKKFNCIVCDDIKDKHCQPWDSFSNSRNCFDDPRINKNLPIGCRKMIQLVGDKTYYSRQCTNLVGDSVQGCVERVGTKKIKIVYCHCRHTENCNGSSRLASEHRLMLVTVAAFLLARISFSF